MKKNPLCGEGMDIFCRYTMSNVRIRFCFGISRIMKAEVKNIKTETVEATVYIVNVIILNATKKRKTKKKQINALFRLISEKCTLWELSVESF